MGEGRDKERSGVGRVKRGVEGCSGVWWCSLGETDLAVIIIVIQLRYCTAKTIIYTIYCTMQ